MFRNFVLIFLGLVSLSLQSCSVTGIYTKNSISIETKEPCWISGEPECDSTTTHDLYFVGHPFVPIRGDFEPLKALAKTFAIDDAERKFRKLIYRTITSKLINEAKVNVLSKRNISDSELENLFIPITREAKKNLKEYDSFFYSTGTRFRYFIRMKANTQEIQAIIIDYLDSLKKQEIPMNYEKLRVVVSNSINHLQQRE